MFNIYINLIIFIPFYIMPLYKKRYKRRAKSKRSWAMSRRRKPFMTPKSLFGDSKFVRLKFVKLGQIPTVPALGIPLATTIRANGAGSPVVGDSGQPRGWDQLSTLWTHYVVYGSRIKIQFMPGAEPGETIIHPIICYVTLDNTPSNLTLPARDAMESRNSTSKAWTPGQGSVTLSKNFSCRQFFGIKDPNDNVQLSAQTTGAQIPLDGAFFSFSASPTHGTAIPATDFVVEISYFIKLTEPRRPNAS